MTDATPRHDIDRDAPEGTVGQAVEQAVLVVILLVVGVAAGAASFTHVHDWTMTHAPPGTPDWFGWANACISELVPIAALLTIRKRLAAGEGVGLYPAALLIAGAALSLSAQLAVAKDNASSKLLSAVPALAFIALIKLIFSATKSSPPAPDHERAMPSGAPAAQPVEPSPTVATPPVDAVATPPADAVATPQRVAEERVTVAASRQPQAQPDDLTRQRGIRMAREGADAKKIVEELAVSLRTAQRYVKASTRDRPPAEIGHMADGQVLTTGSTVRR